MTDEPLDLAPIEAALDSGDPIHNRPWLVALLAEVKRLRAWVDTLQGRNRHDTSLLNGLKQAIGNEADRLGIPKAGETTTSLIAKIARHVHSQSADAWEEGHAAGIDFARHGTYYADNPYRTQPEETP